MEWDTLIVPAAGLLTEVLKRTMKPGSKWLPLIAILLGGILGYLYGLAVSANKEQLIFYVIKGLLYGGSSAGLYKAGSSVLKSKNQESSK